MNTIRLATRDNIKNKRKQKNTVLFPVNME